MSAWILHQTDVSLDPDRVLGAYFVNRSPKKSVILGVDRKIESISFRKKQYISVGEIHVSSLNSNSPLKREMLKVKTTTNIL